ncbi:Small GTP-binding protein Rab1 [Balamuthia mandrillaris]
MGCGPSAEASKGGAGGVGSSNIHGLKVNNAREEDPVVVGESSSSSIRTFSSSHDYLFKILLLGSQGVGKSSLLGRFADDDFQDSYRTTVGVDFKIRTIDVDDKTIKLQLWDTAGQERFKTVTNTYFRGAHGVILVYDITDRKTFTQIEDYWLKEVQNNAPPNAVLMIVGNKCDLSNRAVETSVGKDFAQMKEALFLETSAKEATNVNKAFITLAETIKNRIK